MPDFTQIPKTMIAMVLEEPGKALSRKEIPVPLPAPGQVLVKVHACGVCRTDLHILDGELDRPKLPLVPGHEIVGSIVRRGTGADRFEINQRVGIPWLGYTDETCPYCLGKKENLCENAGFTGYTFDGGYAQYALSDERFCFSIPESFPDLNAAPLLCAGLIGFRAYTLAGQDIRRLGLYGFGAAAHILCQIASQQGKDVYAFTRPGDTRGQKFASRLGAVWAGPSNELPPHKLDAAILFAPVGNLLPLALKAVDKGGVVVAAGIYMSDIPSMPYSLLWEERTVRSVANLTREDGIDFFNTISKLNIKTEVEAFALEKANEALDALRHGTLQGAAVLVPAHPETGLS